MVFDTDVLIWFLRGNQRAAKTIQDAPEKSISIISYMELVQGARDKKELKAIKSFLTDNGINILLLTENIGHRASIYMHEYCLSGGLTVLDSMIAATVVEAGETLCTANIKHFRIIKDLDIVVFKP